MITIVDYGTGNLGSIANMLKKVGVAALVSSDPHVIAEAEKLILPGVGAFDNGMKSLQERGLISVLNERVLHARVPILGLCLGLQLFTKSSEEGRSQGLGWIDAKTVRFKFSEEDGSLKVPHMGWNRARVERSSALFANMPADSRFYFVHSFHLVCADARTVLTSTDHGYTFHSGVEQENIIGLQFHPEKSHKFGMQILRNFAERF